MVRTTRRRRSVQSYMKTYQNYFHIYKDGVAPVFIPLDASNIVDESAELVSLSRTIIKTVIEYTYSLLPYFSMPGITIENQDTAVLRMKSGNCIAFANQVSLLLGEHGIPHVYLPATIPPHLVQPGYPHYAHAVVMVETADHFILHEPAYFIQDPILVPKNGTPVDVPVAAFDTVWKMVYDGATSTIAVSNDGHPEFMYRLCHVTNPSESISFPVNIHNKRIPLVKFSSEADQTVAHLSIRLDTRCLEGYYDGTWFSRLEWSRCVNAAALAAWDGLSDAQCRRLGYKPDILRTIVFAIISRKN